MEEITSKKDHTNKFIFSTKNLAEKLTEKINSYIQNISQKIARRKK
jgi:hypothetical protein